MKRSRIVIVVLAILLALLTTFFLYRYIEGLRKEPEVQVVYGPVVVAATDIPEQVELTTDMLTVVQMPQEAIHADAAANTEDLIGFTTVIPIAAGEQVLKSKVALDDGTSGLSYQIPENMRAIVVPTGEVSGLAGYLKRGDKVDLLVTYLERPLSDATETSETGETEETTATTSQPTDTEGNPIATQPGEETVETTEEQVVFTVTQFQNLEVLELGIAAHVDENGNLVKAVGVPTSVTLLVTPEQAEVVAYMLNTGTFQMSLRNPVDDTIVPLDHYGDDNFQDWSER